MIAEDAEPWVAGQLALALLAVDPAGLGGVVLRARASPVRDACLAGLPPPLDSVRRIAPGIADEQLYSGIDLAATLAMGRLIRSAGILARPATLMLCMAERCPPGLAARLGQALDQRAGHAVIALDEGAEPEERAPATLTDRLAFRLDLDGIRAADLAHLPLSEPDFAAARERLSSVIVPDEALVALTVTALRFGILSLRAPTMAAAAARAQAALMGRHTVADEDLQIAVQLVYAHRATITPADDNQPDTPEPPPPDDQPEPQSDDNSGPSPDALAELLIAAAHAVLPPGLDAALQGAKAAAGAKGAGGAGGKRVNRQRGRPLPARPGRISAAEKIDLIATLRAAAPWQPIRRRTQGCDADRLLIRPGDVHIRRFEERSDRVVIFVVDASGSAAMARLAEAKGAVELMLADAYARRDQVALIAFRKDGADLMLPPTRSLVQTKRRLAGLPGGGGTPLAAGLMAGHDLAQRVARQGQSPALAILTDGRANVPFPPRTGRAAATEDAEKTARLIAATGTPVALLDTGNRPTPALRDLAMTMGGHYVPLPRADSAGLTRAVETALAR